MLWCEMLIFDATYGFMLHAYVVMLSVLWELHFAKQCYFGQNDCWLSCSLVVISPSYSCMHFSLLLSHCNTHTHRMSTHGSRLIQAGVFNFPVCFAGLFVCLLIPTHTWFHSFHVVRAAILLYSSFSVLPFSHTWLHPLHVVESTILFVVLPLSWLYSYYC